MSAVVSTDSKTPVVPFMTYMGGKRKMLPSITPNIPSGYRNYHEAFLGGGAVAIDQMAQWDALETKKPRKFFLSDFSPNVVAAWTAVKDFPHETASILKEMLGNHCRAHFMEVLHWDRIGLIESKSVAERGARFIYLLQTCFGGKVGETKKGFLKMTPRWHHKFEMGHPPYNFDNLFAVSALLNRVDVNIRQDAYETAIDYAGFGDFIYLDPPYDPQADTGETLTTDYIAELVSQPGIRTTIDAMTAKGIMVLMSNADTALVRELFDGFACSRPKHHWAISSTAKAGQEILIANWRLADRLTSTYSLAA